MGNTVNFKALLKRNPLLLLMGQLVSMIGSILQQFALSLYVLDVTGSGIKFASVLAIAIIPQLIIGPFGGVIADKVSRKWLIVILDVISGVVTLIFAYIYTINGELSLISIYIMVLLLSIVQSIFNPTISAIIPDIVEDKDLADINSSVSFISSSVSIIGPILGGIIFGIFGIFIMMVINGISFLASAFSETFIKPDREHHQENKGIGFFVSFKEGLKYVFKTPTLLMLSFVAVIANTSLTPIFTIGLPFRLRSELGVNEMVYGLNQSIVMGGAILGSLIATYLVKKYSFNKLVSAILTITSILLMLIGIFSYPNLLSGNLAWIVLVIIGFIIMAGVITANISLGTAKQKMVPGKLQGRVNGVISTFATASVPLGQMIYGGMLEKFDMYIITLIFASILLLAGVISFAGFGYLKKINKLVVINND